MSSTLPDRSRLKLPTASTVFRTVSGETGGGYYHSSSSILPWTLSRGPLERFSIFVVERPLEGDGAAGSDETNHD